MVKVYQAKPLTMEWCINCHKNPTEYLREPSKVTQMGYQFTALDREAIKKKNEVNPPINCSACHR